MVGSSGGEVAVRRAGGRIIRGLAGRVLVLGLLSSTACAVLPARAGKLPVPENFGSVRVTDRLLAERVRSLQDRSPTWRAALDSLAVLQFQVLVGTPEQLGELVPALSSYAGQHIGRMLPLGNRNSQLIGAAVLIDLAVMERMARAAGASQAMLEGDIDRILAHELYGHVLPLAIAGRPDRGCADPAPHEPAVSSCSVRRENRIRAELGLPPRTTYDLRALAIGRILFERDGAVLQDGQ